MINYRKIEMLPIDCKSVKKLDEPVLQWVAIENLVIDPRYQREIERRGLNNITKIAKNFDWSRFSPILCTPVDGGKFAIIDGQHRTYAARACNIKNVPAMIVEMTDQEAAESFVWVNASVTQITPAQIYKSSLAAGLPWAIECREVVEASGCKLMSVQYSSGAKKTGQVFCVTVVRNLIEEGHKQTIIKVLSALVQSGIDDPYNFSASILRPIFNVFKELKVETSEILDFISNNDLLDIEHSVHKLRETPAYFRQSKSKLFTACLHAKWNEYQREKELQQ